MSLIDIKNLNFSYRANEAEVSIFKDFNLSVKKGEFIAIKGPSGSGKSTLLYLIAGLLKPSSGEVHIQGKDIFRLEDLDLAILRNSRIGFIFQQFHLLPKTSVKENILLPTLYPSELKNKQEGVEKKVLELAQSLGIENRLDHHPNQLSGGQQQRVAIARALIKGADIILADEPTGNLDSHSTQQIIQILRELHDKGKTIILITHEEEVAKQASTIHYFRDGRIIESSQSAENQEVLVESSMEKREFSSFQYLNLIPLAFKNAFRNKARSILTMLGITVGVGAVCAMITLGNYTKNKILDSYAELGVNTIKFRGYPSWNLKATDKYPLKFQFFSWERELLPLKKVFPSIQYISPRLSIWDASASYGGKSLEKKNQLIGVSQDGLSILNRKLLAGKNFSPFHIEKKSSVCIIGLDVGKELFKNSSPLNKILHITLNKTTFSCLILGVLASKTSNKEWASPNQQIFLPFTLFQSISDNWWSSQIKQVTIQFRPQTDMERNGRAIRKFFELKYEISGEFRVDSDSILLAQMKKFLDLFSVLLASIALISLLVGGMGITNMMLVSVSERFKEIGIRKSMGASDSSIKFQFLFESIILCTMAGLSGIFFGILAYHGAIWGASKVMNKVQFEWVFDPFAISLSLISILAVGILSGLVPAIKAQKLQVIDALRSE